MIFTYILFKKYYFKDQIITPFDFLYKIANQFFEPQIQVSIMFLHEKETRKSQPFLNYHYLANFFFFFFYRQNVKTYLLDILTEFLSEKN